jgi:predicted nucleic acid-binding protein
VSEHPVGLLDTSVVVALPAIPVTNLPQQAAIAAITLAELAAGPAAADDPGIRATRQAQLQVAESEFDVLPFDQSAARAYGQVYAATLQNGRKPRGPRAMDLLIAATALANGLPLFTANPADFDHLAALITVIPARPADR